MLNATIFPSCSLEWGLKVKRGKRLLLCQKGKKTNNNNNNNNILLLCSTVRERNSGQEQQVERKKTYLHLLSSGLYCNSRDVVPGRRSRQWHKCHTQLCGHHLSSLWGWCPTLRRLRWAIPFPLQWV